MSANPKAVAHYKDFAEQAREAEKNRAIIHQLRMQLHACIAELSDISVAFKGEIAEWDALIARSKATLLRTFKATLLRTLPGGELDAAPLVGGCASAPDKDAVPAGGDALDALDAMTQPERRETLRDAMFDIAMSAATFEAQHTGPLNWSGKELK